MSTPQTTAKTKNNFLVLRAEQKTSQYTHQGVPMAAAGCCRLLLAAAGCCWLLLAVSWCWLLVAAAGCWLLLAVGCCWLALPLASAGCRWLPLAATGSESVFEGRPDRESTTGSTFPIQRCDDLNTVGESLLSEPHLCDPNGLRNVAQMHVGCCWLLAVVGWPCRWLLLAAAAFRWLLLARNLFSKAGQTGKVPQAAHFQYK